MEITWDLVVLSSLILGTFYGAFVGRNKILGILVYLYLGLAVAQACGEVVFGWVGNFGFISSQLATTEFGVKTLIFLAVAIALMFKSEISGLDSAGSLGKVETGLLGLLTAGFALASIFAFMTETELQALDSNFALVIYSYRAILIVVPVLMMVGLSFLKRN